MFLHVVGYAWVKCINLDFSDNQNIILFQFKMIVGSDAVPCQNDQKISLTQGKVQQLDVFLCFFFQQLDVDEKNNTKNPNKHDVKLCIYISFL
jgi:hypothetical protein